MATRRTELAGIVRRHYRAPARPGWWLRDAPEFDHMRWLGVDPETLTPIRPEPGQAKTSS